jgi:hypothetical protein
MDPLAWALRAFVNQDVARYNAASAAARLFDQRRQREDVDAFLAQRLDGRGGPGTPVGGGAHVGTGTRG